MESYYIFLKLDINFAIVLVVFQVLNKEWIEVNPKV